MASTTMFPEKHQPNMKGQGALSGKSLVPLLVRFDNPTSRIIRGRNMRKYKTGTEKRHILAIEKGVRVLLDLINECPTSAIDKKYSRIKLNSCLSKIMEVKRKIERLLSRGGLVKSNSREMCTQTNNDKVYDKLELGVNKNDLPKLLLDKWPAGSFRYTQEKCGNIFDEKDQHLVIVMDLAKDGDQVIPIKSRLPALENLIQNGLLEPGKVATSLRKGSSHGNSKKGIYIVTVNSGKGDLCTAQDLIAGVGIVEGMGVTRNVIYGSTTVETGDLLKKLVEYNCRRSKNEDDTPSVVYTGRVHAGCVSCNFKKVILNEDVYSQTGNLLTEGINLKEADHCIEELDLNQVLSSDWPLSAYSYTMEKTGSVFEEKDAHLIIALDLSDDLSNEVVRGIKSRMPNLDYLIANNVLKAGKVANVLRKEVGCSPNRGLYVIAVNSAGGDLDVAKDLIDGINKLNNLGVNSNVIYGSSTVKLGDLLKKIVEYFSRCSATQRRLNLVYTGRKRLCNDSWFKMLQAANVTGSEKNEEKKSAQETTEVVKVSEEINVKLENGVEENELPELLLQDWPSECFRYVQERKGNIMEEVDADLAIVLDMGNDVDSAVGREVKKKMPNLEDIIKSGILEGGKILSMVRDESSDETDKRGMHVITVDSKKGDLTAAKDLTIGLETVKNMTGSNFVVYGACSVEMGVCLKKLVEYQSRREGLTEGLLRLIYIDRIEPETTTEEAVVREELPSWDVGDDSCDAGEGKQVCEEASVPGALNELEKSGKKRKGKENEDTLCHICGKQFKYSFKKHLQTHLAIRPYPCSICKKRFYSKMYVREHMRTHTGEKPFVCEICGKAFARQCKLKVHYNCKHVGIRPHQCEICGKRFSQRASLRVHQRSHREALPFACSVCYDRFKDEEIMKVHMLRHTGEETLYKRTIEKEKKKNYNQNKFKCEVCEKLFQSRPRLDDHIRIHTGERPFCCSICGKTFHSQIGYKTHMQLHDGRFECNICGKRVSMKTALEVHMRKHTGEKPYPCELCDLHFQTQAHLKRHLLVHTKEKKHVCAVCSRAFALNENLKAHMKIHMQENKLLSFGCSFCEKRFGTSRSLKKHLLTHSSVDPEQDYTLYQ